MKLLVEEVLDIDCLIQSGLILASALNISKQVINPGTSPKYIDFLIEKFILSKKALPSFKGYMGYPCASCISVNEQIVHAIPSDVPLKEGDLITVDIGVSYKGHCTDAARTYLVGSTENRKILKMLNLVHTALDNAINETICGNTTGHISFAIQKILEKNNLSTPLELGGHGIGTEPHQPPFIPNYGVKGSGVDIINGMCLAIEPIMIDGSNQVVLGADNWTVSTKDGSISVHEEDTVVVSGSSPVILTRATLEGGLI